MALRNIFSLVVSKFVISVLPSVSLVSCGTVYELYAPPGANLNTSLQGKYENPDKYRVPDAERKTYIASKTFSPPQARRAAVNYGHAMADVQAGDVWVVTHRVQERLIIFSTQFQARQERALSGKGNYLYCLIIDPDGRINKGWFFLRDPKYVVLASERMTIMDPSIRDTDGWPTEPVFALQK